MLTMWIVPQHAFILDLTCFYSRFSGIQQIEDIMSARLHRLIRKCFTKRRKCTNHSHPRSAVSVILSKRFQRRAAVRVTKHSLVHRPPRFFFSKRRVVNDILHTNFDANGNCPNRPKAVVLTNLGGDFVLGLGGDERSSILSKKCAFKPLCFRL